MENSLLLATFRITSHDVTSSPRKAESLLDYFLLVSSISLKDGKGRQSHLESAPLTSPHKTRNQNTQHTGNGKFTNDVDIWVFPKIGVPQNGWFIMENLIKIDDLRVPLFLERPIFQEGYKETSEDFLGYLLRLDTFSPKISGLSLSSAAGAKKQKRVRIS